MGLSHTAIARELRKQEIVLTRLQVKKECKKISSLDKWIDEIKQRKMKTWKKDLRDHF